MAEITQERVTDLANLSNDAVYTLHCDANASLDRGYLAYCSQYTHAVLADVGGSYAGNGVSSTADDVCVYWMIYTSSSGNRYLFNVANGKFYSVDGSGSVFSESASRVSAAKVTCASAHVGSDYFEFTPSGSSNLISATPAYGKNDAAQVTARTREHGATEWSVVKVSGDEINSLKTTYATNIQNAIEAIENTYFVTITGAAGTVTVNGSTVGNGGNIISASEITASDVQTLNVDGYLRTLSVTSNTITVNYYAVPRLSTGGDQHLYLLYNNNRGQYVSYSNATSNMATSKNVPDVDKASFYFTQSTTVPSTEEYLAVNIHNVATGADMTLNAYSSWGNSEPRTWYIRRSGSGGYPNAICIAENATGGNGLNDYGSTVDGWSASDNGSSWKFEEVRETPYAGWTNLKLKNTYSSLYLAITTTTAPTASIVEEANAGVFSIESNGSHYALKSSYDGNYYYLTTSGAWNTGNATDPAYVWNIEETDDGFAITRATDGKYLHSTDQSTASVYTDGDDSRNGIHWNIIKPEEEEVPNITSNVTFDNAGTPITTDELVALANTGKRFGLMVVNQNNNMYKKWFGFTSTTSRVDNLTDAQLFTLTGETDNYTITRESDNGNVVTQVKLLNRSTGDTYAGYTAAMSTSIDNAEGNHYNANSYNFASGTGSWSCYVAYGPFYYADVNYMCNGNKVATGTFIVREGGTITEIPEGYILAGESPVVTEDGTYTVNVTKDEPAPFVIEDGKVYAVYSHFTNGDCPITNNNNVPYASLTADDTPQLFVFSNSGTTDTKAATTNPIYWNLKRAEGDGKYLNLPAPQGGVPSWATTAAKVLFLDKTNTEYNTANVPDGYYLMVAGGSAANYAIYAFGNSSGNNNWGWYSNKGQTGLQVTNAALPNYNTIFAVVPKPYTVYTVTINGAGSLSYTNDEDAELQRVAQSNGGFFAIKDGVTLDESMFSAEGLEIESITIDNEGHTITASLCLKDGGIYSIANIITNGNKTNYVEVNAEGNFALTSETATAGKQSLWVAHKNGGSTDKGTTYYFTSAYDPSKYLANGGVSTTKQTWDVSAGSIANTFALYNAQLNGGRYVVGKSDCTAFGTWGTGGHWADRKAQASTYSTDFRFTENTDYTVYTVTITGIPAEYNAQVTVDDKTAGNGSSIVAGAALTAGDVTVPTFIGYAATKTVADGAITITYALNPADYFTSTDDATAGNYTWLRLNNSNREPNTNSRSPKAVEPGADVEPAVAATDIAEEKMLWAFVGTNESFKIVSKTNPGYVLQAKALNSVNSHTGLVAEGDADASLSTWKIDNSFINVASKPGYGILLADGNDTQALNDHTSCLRFWNYNEGATGSRWTITPVEEQTITIVQDGENPYPNNTKMGKVTATYGTTTATTIYHVGETGVRTLYLPKGIEVTLSLGDSFRGYIPSLNTETKTVTFTVDADNKAQYLFYSTEHGRPYRIPAIAKTINGDLIALSDDRFCGNDIGYGRVDIVGRISTDNGATWGAEFPVATGDGDNSSPTCGYGDAAIVADRESNKVMMMCVSAPNGGTCWNERQRGVISISPDGGRTWPTPVDIKDQICNTESSLLPGVINYFVGSGKLHQSRYIKVGDYYRVYAALWTTPNGSAINNYVIYTDDFGTTWHLLGSAETPCVNGGNEPKCEEMPDGSVVISSRKGGGRYYNVFTYTDTTTGAGSWGTQVNGCTSGDSSTNGEILIVNAKKTDDSVVPVAIQSMPNRQRNDVTIWYKELTETSGLSDLAGDWTVGKQVSQISSCYSTMCIQQDKRIAFFFEEGPGGYDMVYVPFNIADITNGQYVDIIQDYSAPVKKDAEEATKELQKAGKVGYPSISSTAYRNLLDAISAAADVDGANATECKEARTAIQTALTAYYAETNIALPQRGKVYRFRGSNFKNTFNEADDQWAYLNDTNTKHVTEIDASTSANNGMFMQEEASEASNWLCIAANAEANEFKFVSANGNNFGYQTITAQPAIVKISRAVGSQVPAENGIKPYNNLYGFVNMKVGMDNGNTTWMCAIPAQTGGAWNLGDRQNGISGNTAGLGFGVSWGGSWYYPDWRIEEAEDADAQAYVKKYADIQLNTIGNPINDEYTALKTLLDQTEGRELSSTEEEELFQATESYMNSVKTGYANANTASGVVLPTGYYRIKSPVSKRYLFNDKNYDAANRTWATSTATDYYAAHSDHNNLVWKITRHDDGVHFDIQNGQGTPMLRNGKSYSTLTFTHYNGQNHSIYFDEGLHDQGNGTEDQGSYKSGKNDGIHYIVDWLHTDAGSSYWILEPADDEEFWTVNIYDTDPNTYAMKQHTGCSAEGTAYIYNGGFVGYPAGATVDGTDILTSRDAEVTAGTLMKNVIANATSKIITICFGTEIYNQTIDAHSALMNDVLTKLQNSGLGYPKATSQARRDLYKAVSMCDRQYTGSGEHAKNGSLITIEYLQTCLNNFINDVDVELPVAGHVYTFCSTFDDDNRYVVDSNEGYLVNPVKGDSNGFAFQAPSQNGHLQSGGYWLCTEVAANGTCLFRSAEGNWLGANAIATSETAAQRIMFSKGAGFGNLLMRQGTNGSYMAANSNGTMAAVGSTIASATQTTDWKVTATDMNYVYFINVTSNKPRTYANQIYNLKVSMTGTVAGYTFTETTSGVGFFVVDDAVLAPAAGTTCSANDLDNFYKNDDATLANRPTATINQTNKTVDVHYTFDYDSGIRELYAQATALLDHNDFGWPKDDSPTRLQYANDLLSNYDNENSWEYKYWDIFSENPKPAALNEDAYNELANLMLAYEGNIPDDEINLPKNGSSVLLTNVFTNDAIHKEYQNYLYHEGNQLKLGMSGTQKSELGFGTNIIPSAPTENFFWVIQRDDEQTVTRVEETVVGRTDYNGADRYAIEENGRNQLTATDDITAAAAQFVSGEFKTSSTTVEDGHTTTVTTTDVLVESTTTPVVTRDATVYTGGSDSEAAEKNYISLNGSYKTHQTYGQFVLERVVTETTVISPLFYEVNGEGNVTSNETTTNTGYPVYVRDGNGDATDIQKTREDVSSNTEYYRVEKRVNMIDQVVSVQRRYPSYYISTRVGDGYIGKSTSGTNNTVKTDDHNLQFNVSFVRGTKLGTVGILYMLNNYDNKPRYIVGNLEGSRLDRYNSQVAYDTEKATSVNGIWSTDWYFIQSRNADTHTGADDITVNGTPIKQDGQTVKHDDVIDSWTTPINLGHTVNFGASQSVTGDVNNPTFGGDEDTQQSYATLNLPYAIELSNATQHVYIVTALEETEYSTRKKLSLTDIKDYLEVTDKGGNTHYILPRETPVLIENNTDVTYHYGVANAFESYVSPERLAEVRAVLAVNQFKGTLGRVNSPSGKPYILARKKATIVDGTYKGKQPYTVAFYPLAQGSYLAANKAYIDFDNITVEPKATSVKGAMWTIDDEEESTMDIETLVPDLIIELDTETGEIYDIQGRKLNDAPQHGVYIQNGKKYIAK